MYLSVRWNLHSLVCGWVPVIRHTRDTFYFIRRANTFYLYVTRFPLTTNEKKNIYIYLLTLVLWRQSYGNFVVKAYVFSLVSGYDDPYGMRMSTRYWITVMFYFFITLSECIGCIFFLFSFFLSFISKKGTYILFFFFLDFLSLNHSLVGERMLLSFLASKTYDEKIQSKNKNIIIKK